MHIKSTIHTLIATLIICSLLLNSTTTLAVSQPVILSDVTLPSSQENSHSINKPDESTQPTVASPSLALASFARSPLSAQTTTQQQPFELYDFTQSQENTVRITANGFEPTNLDVTGPTDVIWINETDEVQIIQSGESQEEPTPTAVSPIVTPTHTSTPTPTSMLEEVIGNDSDLTPEPTSTDNKIHLPIIQNGGNNIAAQERTTKAAVFAANYLRQQQATNTIHNFRREIQPGQSYTYRFTAPGQHLFHLQNQLQHQGTVTLSGTALLSTSPRNGEDGVATTRETIFEFSGPLDPDSVTNAAFSAQAVGQALNYRLHLSPDQRRVTLFYDESLPGNTRINVTLNESLRDAQNAPIDLRGDGTTGGTTSVEFDTLSVNMLTGTSVCGRVFASELEVRASNVSVNKPLQGATITVDGMEETLRTVTDASGNFCLDPAPVGRFFVHINGRTASAGVPEGAYYPFVGKTWTSVPGQESSVGDIYLPLVLPGTLQEVSQEEDTAITFVDEVLEEHPEFAGVSILVPADSLYSDDGSRGGSVGIAPVPPDRLPGTLPDYLNFPVVITVQTDGATNFDEPAPVCFPNLPDPETGELLEAGEKSALFSFNHDTGGWEIAGSMTVMDDGQLICTDPGVGVRAPGWHGTQPGSELDTPPPPEPDDDCPGIGRNQAWSIAKAVGGCFKKIARALKGLTGVVDAVRSAQKLKSDLSTIRTKYESGQLTGDDLQSAVENLKGVKENIAKVYEAISAQNPVTKAVQVAKCAESIADAIIGTICDNKKCLGSGVTFICDKITPLTDLAKSLIDKADDLEKSIREAPVAALCLGFDALIARLSIPGNQVAASATFTSDPEILALFDDAIGLANSVATELQPVAEAYEELEEINTITLEIQKDVDTLVRMEGGFDNAYYRLVVNENEIRGQTESSGLLSLRVPSGQSYKLEILAFSAGVLLVSEGTTPEAGQTAQFAPFISTDLAEEEDDDGDGIANIAEPVIGTDPDNPDTDNDGLPDGGEVQQGTNPLDGMVMQTGIVGSADTPGRAWDICTTNQIAVVTDTSANLIFFNIFNEMTPLLIDQINTPGTLIEVACTDNFLAVADGESGLSIFDISDIDNINLVQQVAISGNSIDVAADGTTAYIGTQEGQIIVIDMLTGTILDEVTLNSGIADMVTWQTNLYVRSNDSQLSIYETTGGELTHLGSVISPDSTGEHLFVGNGTAYMAHRRGYNTFDVSDPTAPTLISRGNTDQFGWAGITTNGSGIGVGRVGINSSGSRNILLYDTTDPARTDAFITQFDTPGSASAVSIQNGLAYVADGNSGLLVINYLAFDNQKQDPTLSISTNFAPGVAEEGTTMSIFADATDDVQVRHIEFLVDGERQTVDGSFPFEGQVITPRLAQQESFTLTVRAFDTGGNVTEVAEQIRLTTDATPPRIAHVIPRRDSFTRADQTNSITFVFNESVDVSTLTNASIQLFAAGQDGIVGTDDDIEKTGGKIDVTDGMTATLTFNELLSPGLYQAMVGTGVTDANGNGLASAFSWTFELVPVLGYEQVYSGQISTLGEIDRFFFEGKVDEVLNIGVSKTSGDMDPSFIVYGPDGSELCQQYSFGGGAATACVPKTDGVYSILVSSKSNSLGTYDTYVERIYVSSNVSTLEFEQLVTDTIEPATDIDVYTFEGTANEELSISVIRASSDVDPSLVVYGPDGTELCKGRDFGDTLIIRCIPTMDGAHSILVLEEGRNASGTYNIYLQKVYNPANATALEFEQLVSGEISPAVDMDIYTFEGKEDDTIAVSTIESGQLSIRSIIYSPDGTELCSIDGAHDIKTTECTLKSDGIHRILVWDLHEDKIGTYSIYIQNIYHTTNISELEFEQLVSSEIDPPMDMDVYRIEAKADDELSIGMLKTSGNIYPSFIVYGPDGAEICRQKDTRVAVASCTATADGPHLILVSDDDKRRGGTYEFYVESLYASSNISTLEFEQLITDTIDAATDVDIYTFEGIANEELSISVIRASGGIDPSLVVYGPDGTELCKGRNFGDTLTVRCTPTIDGIHSILVLEEGRDASGTYNVYLQKVYNPADATVLEFEQLVSGEISPAVDMDVYTFEGQKDDTIAASIFKKSGGIYLDSIIYSPDNTELCRLNSTGFDIDTTICTLKADGTHLILVWEEFEDDTGTYDIYVQNIYDSTNISDLEFEQLVSSEIDPPMDMDIYRIEAKAGDELSIGVLKTSGAIYPSFIVYGPDGTEICRQKDTRVAVASCTATADGPHLILVSDDDKRRGGTYEFYVESLYASSNISTLEFEQLITDTIDPAIDVDVYRIKAKAGDELQINVTRISENFNPFFIMYDPEGSEICRDGSYGNSASATCLLAIEGSHSIQVSSYGRTSAGSYEILVGPIE